MGTVSGSYFGHTVSTRAGGEKERGYEMGVPTRTTASAGEAAKRPLLASATSRSVCHT